LVRLPFVRARTPSHSAAWRFQSFLWHELAIRPSSRRLVLPASAFSQILSREIDIGHVFCGNPLAALSGKVRGDVLGDLVRSVMSQKYPNSQIVDPAPGRCVNGRSRSKASAEYDWLHDGRRVECKSAQLHWSGGCWSFQFASIQFDKFDDLLLAFSTPSHIHIYHHDCILGKSSQGLLSGSVVKLRGPSKETRWHIALEVILAKLDIATNACEHICDVSLCDAMVQTALSRRPIVTERVYEGIPLAACSTSRRGACIEAIARVVDGQLHSDISSAPSTLKCVNGSHRGWHRTAYDWNRGGTRVECKSAQLAWDRSNRRWRVMFSNIKLQVQGGAAFDELLLALSTPNGIYMYRHDGQLGVSTCGTATAIRGHRVHVCGRCGDFDWRSALDTELSKLDKSGCERIAFVKWDM